MTVPSISCRVLVCCCDDAYNFYKHILSGLLYWNKHSTTMFITLSCCALFCFPLYGLPFLLVIMVGKVSHTASAKLTMSCFTVMSDCTEIMTGSHNTNSLAMSHAVVLISSTFFILKMVVNC